MAVDSVTLKNTSNEDVVFTLIGNDMSSAKYVVMGAGSNSSQTTLDIQQQRARFGSKTSHRVNVKAAVEDTAVGPTPGSILVRKASVSVLFTIPPETSTDELQDLMGYLTQYLSAVRLSALVAGAV